MTFRLRCVKGVNCSHTEIRPSHTDRLCGVHFEFTYFFGLGDQTPPPLVSPSSPSPSHNPPRRYLANRHIHTTLSLSITVLFGAFFLVKGQPPPPPPAHHPPLNPDASTPLLHFVLDPTETHQGVLVANVHSLSPPGFLCGPLFPSTKAELNVKALAATTLG